MTKPLDRLSFQLYSSRSIRGLDEQFRLLAGLGYRFVEPYGDQFVDVDSLRDRLRAHGLRTPSSQVSIDRLRADMKGVVHDAKLLEIGLLAVPWVVPGRRPTDIGGWKALAAELEGFARVLGTEGINLAWHNHDFEYPTVAPGVRPIDIILGAGQALQWEADVAWVARAGADPVAELARYSGRVSVCHIKDLAPAGSAPDEQGWADVGHGTLDWSTLLPAMKSAGAGLFVAEHDSPSDVERFARRARAMVAAWV